MLQKPALLSLGWLHHNVISLQRGTEGFIMLGQLGGRVDRFKANYLSLPIR